MHKSRITRLVTFAEKESLRKQLGEECPDVSELRPRMKGLYPSDHVVGTREWGLDVRRFISDRAKSMSELVPPSQHINLQARRVKFVVFCYWAKSRDINLSADIVGGA